MSDTPRTDAFLATYAGHSGFLPNEVERLSSLARQLERELAEANQRIRELTEWRPMETAPRGDNILARDVLGAIHIVCPAVTPGLWLNIKSDRSFIPGSLNGWLPLPKGDA